MKTKIPFVIALFVIFIINATFVSAASGETIIAGAPSIPELCETDKKGVVIDLLLTIAKKGDLNIEITIYPAKRVI